MNASEAAKIAEKVRLENKKKREASERKSRVEKSKRIKEAREVFIKSFNEDADTGIAEAAQSGKKKYTVFVGTGDYQNKAEDQFAEHEYADIINKTVARLRRQGFKVAKQISAATYYTNYEAGEEATYYKAAYVVSWE